MKTNVAKSCWMCSHDSTRAVSCLDDMLFKTFVCVCMRMHIILCGCVFAMLCMKMFVHMLAYY